MKNCKEYEKNMEEKKNLIMELHPIMTALWPFYDGTDGAIESAPTIALYHFVRSASERRERLIEKWKSKSIDTHWNNAVLHTADTLECVTQFRSGETDSTFNSVAAANRARYAFRSLMRGLRVSMASDVRKSAISYRLYATQPTTSAHGTHV